MKRLFKYEVLFSLFFLFGILSYLFFPDFNTIEFFIKENENFSIFLYMLIYVVAGLLGLSLVSLTVLGGLIFDFKLALILSFIAVSICTILAYIISKFIKSHLDNFGFKIHFKSIEKIILKIQKNLKHQTIVKLGILRVILPAIQFSYAAGFLKEISIRDYMIVTLIINFITTFNVLFFGVGILKNPNFIIIVICILLFLFIFKKQIHKYID